MSGQEELATLLERISAELVDLERSGLRLEIAVGDLIGSGGPAFARSLQELDELVQRVRDLAAFTGALAEAAPCGTVHSQLAFERLKLGRIRASLAGEPDSAQGARGEETLF